MFPARSQKPLYELRRLGDAGRALVLGRRWEARERWSRKRLHDHQRQALRALLRRALADSPFYREHLGALPRGVETPLAELPTLDKETMMARWDEVVTDRRLRLAGVREHVDRLRGDECHLGEYRVCATSGSTGQPAIFTWNRREWSTALVGALRWNAFMGVRPRLGHRIRYAAIGAASPIHQTTRMSATIDVGLLRLLRLEATTPMQRLMEGLNSFQPEAINAYPSIAALLALEQLGGRLRIAPRVVCTLGEVRTPEMADRIREAWGSEPYDCYGVTEVGVFGSDDGHHRGIHAFEDLFLLEVVDADGRAVPDGEQGHRCLITNLYNHTQPLIRYELSDLLTMSPEPCPCGRPFRLVERIEGRSDDILDLPAAGGTVQVHPIHLRSPMAALADVRQYQFVYADGRLDLYVVPREGVDARAVVERAERTLIEKLGELGVAREILTVHLVDRLEEREAAHAAKFKLVRIASGPAAERGGAHGTD